MADSSAPRQVPLQAPRQAGRPRWYVLGGPDGRTPVPATLLQWAAWSEHASRVVAVAIGVGPLRLRPSDAAPKPARISTVFLGLDHRFGDDDGAPLVFETLVFGGRFDGACRRYASWDAAMDGHLACLRALSADAEPW